MMMRVGGVMWGDDEGGWGDALLVCPVLSQYPLCPPTPYNRTFVTASKRGEAH